MAEKQALTLRQQLVATAVFAVIGLVLTLVIAFFKYGAAEIGGESYRAISDQRQLMAQASLAPLFAAETMLHVEEVMNPESGALFGEAMLALKANQSAYEASKQQWKLAPLSPAVRAALDKACLHAGDMFARIIDQLEPALRSGNRDEATATYADIRNDYALHRAAIAELATLLEQQVAAAEAQALSQSHILSLLLVALVVVAALATLAMFLWIGRDLRQRLGADPFQLLQLTRDFSLGEAPESLPEARVPGSVMAMLVDTMSRLRLYLAEAQISLGLRQAVDRLDGAVMVVDNSLTITYINARLQRRLAAWQQAAGDEGAFELAVGNDLGRYLPGGDGRLLTKACSAGAKARIELAGHKLLLAVRSLKEREGFEGYWIEWHEPPAEVAHNPDFARCRAMVVESSGPMRALQAAVLSELGVGQIDDVRTGAEALNLLASHHYDVVLCDWEMTGMTGLELLKHLRSDPRTKATPFVMCTTVAERQGILAAIQAGASDYVIKPFTRKVFQEKVSKALNKSRAAAAS